jgi:hypothetical protein
MKLNACNLLLAHMVYLYPKHNPFISCIHTIIIICTYTQINDTEPWRNPLSIPLANSLSPKSLLLTYSSFRGAILVHPGPRLLVN